MEFRFYEIFDLTQLNDQKRTGYIPQHDCVKHYSLWYIKRISCKIFASFMLMLTFEIFSTEFLLECDQIMQNLVYK